MLRPLVVVVVRLGLLVGGATIEAMDRYTRVREGCWWVYVKGMATASAAIRSRGMDHEKGVEYMWVFVYIFVNKCVPNFPLR